MRISTNKCQRLWQGKPPQPGLVCGIGDDDPDPDPGGGDDPPVDPPADPSPDPPPTPAVITMTPEEFNKRIESERKAAAAAARKEAKGRNRNKSKTPPTPSPASPAPQELAEVIASSVSAAVTEQFKSLRNEISQESQRKDYDSFMGKFGMNESQVSLFWPAFSEAKPENREKWLFEQLTKAGIVPPKELRSVADLPTIGPSGTRDLELVDSVFDLTDDERKKLGKKKIREMVEAKRQGKRSSNPFGG